MVYIYIYLNSFILRYFLRVYEQHFCFPLVLDLEEFKPIRPLLFLFLDAFIYILPALELMYLAAIVKNTLSTPSDVLADVSINGIFSL